MPPPPIVGCQASQPVSEQIKLCASGEADLSAAAFRVNVGIWRVHRGVGPRRIARVVVVGGATAAVGAGEGGLRVD